MRKNGTLPPISVVLLLAGTALAAAGCGGGSSAATKAADSVYLAAVTRAADVTDRVPGYKFTLTSTATVNGNSTTISASGALNERGSEGEMTTEVGGESLEEVIDQPYVYFDVFEVGEPLVAAIDGGGQHYFVATVDNQRATIAVIPAAFAEDGNGRVPELWLIPSDGKPRPLGLLRANRAVTIKLPPPLTTLTARNSVLAVSLEPPGGSPTGRPTGPVVASGKLENL